jgi:hypothetical protein
MSSLRNGTPVNSAPEFSPARRSPSAAVLADPVPLGPEVPVLGIDVGQGTSSGRGDLAAEFSRERAKRRADRQVRGLVVGADYELRRRVAHPDGGERPVAEVLNDEAGQRAEIENDRALGSRKHNRLARWIRQIPKCVLAFDFGLLLYFFAGITNVNWASPLSLALAFAGLLAAMVTVLSFGFLAFTGNRLRSHKNPAGTIHHEDVDAFSKAAFGAALAVILVVAALMFLRMRTEVLYALGNGAQRMALVIAIALAVVSATANFLVIAIHALDGSDQVARLDKLSAAARKPAAKAHRMRHEAARRGASDPHGPDFLR